MKRFKEKKTFNIVWIMIRISVTTSPPKNTRKALSSELLLFCVMVLITCNPIACTCRQQCSPNICQGLINNEYQVQVCLIGIVITWRFESLSTAWKHFLQSLSTERNMELLSSDFNWCSSSKTSLANETVCSREKESFNCSSLRKSEGLFSRR